MKFLLIILYVNGGSTIIPFKDPAACGKAMYGLDVTLSAGDIYQLNGEQLASVSCVVELNNE